MAIKVAKRAKAELGVEPVFVATWRAEAAREQDGSFYRRWLSVARTVDT